MDLKPYFKKAQLIPAIIIDDTDGTVLMLAYMNEESLRQTMETFAAGILEQGRHQRPHPEGGFDHRRLRRRHPAHPGAPDRPRLPHRQPQLLF